jgi:hypothetical protein
MVTSSLKKGENENRSCSLLPNPWRRNTIGDFTSFSFDFLIR